MFCCNLFEDKKQSCTEAKNYFVKLVENKNIDILLTVIIDRRFFVIRKRYRDFSVYYLCSVIK